MDCFRSFTESDSYYFDRFYFPRQSIVVFCFYRAGSLGFVGSGYFRHEMCLLLRANRDSALLFKIQLLSHAWGQYFGMQKPLSSVFQYLHHSLISAVLWVIPILSFDI